MTQPKFAPIALQDETRPSAKLEVPRPWTPHRPGEFHPSPAGRQRGQANAGPDQGYAALLARRFVDKIKMAPGEYLDDALAAAVEIALRRASLYGRAPVATDIEVALGLLGYLHDTSPEVVAHRRVSVGGVAHDAWRRSQLADQVSESALRRSPSETNDDPPWGAFAATH